MNNTFLITRPNHDPSTNYLFYWSKKIINVASKKNFKILDLAANKACKKTFESYLKKQKPVFICFNGHGSARTIAGQDNKDLVKINDNENLLAGKIIYARCCNAARLLGKSCIKSKTRAFIGYTKNFAFMRLKKYISKPLQDPLAKLFLKPSNSIAISILKGNTTEKSHKKSQKLMLKTLNRLLSSQASPETRDAVSSLWRNIKHQVVLGDKQAKIN